MKEPTNGPTVSLFLPSAKGLSGASRPSAPAVEGKTGFIPKGYCVAWNKGGCSKDNCIYKHETPKPGDKSQKPSKTRGRSTDRSGSPKPKGKGKRICKFWKQGRCDQGADCNFLHEGSAGKPRQATPARSASGDSKNKAKRRLVRTQKGRDPTAQVAQRAQRAQGHRNSKDRGPAPLNRHPPLFALLHPCLHPCPRPCASPSRESFVHRFVLMSLRM